MPSLIFYKAHRRPTRNKNGRHARTYERAPEKWTMKKDQGGRMQTRKKWRLLIKSVKPRGKLNRFPPSSAIILFSYLSCSARLEMLILPPGGTSIRRADLIWKKREKPLLTARCVYTPQRERESFIIRINNLSREKIFPSKRFFYKKEKKPQKKS